MLFMTAKLDRNKVLIALGAVAVLILAIILLFGGGSNQTTTTVNLSSNDARVDYLNALGWEVHAAPAESGQVRIPKESSEV